MTDQIQYTTVIKKDGSIHAQDVDGLFEELRRLQQWRRRPSLSALPDVCEVKDVLPLLPLNRDTLYEAIREGRFPAKRIGLRKLVIPKKALVEWLDDCLGDTPD